MAQEYMLFLLGPLLVWPSLKSAVSTFYWMDDR